MDLNLMMLRGRLAAPPELRDFESGSQLARLLVTVRSDEPRKRIDVIPVTWWDPDREVLETEVGRRVWVTGSVQRRFWDGDAGRRSRLEIVAEQVCLHEEESVDVH